MGLNPEDIIDGKYQIVRLLGEGGMGAVYEGLNVRIQRRVAIKVLHGSVAQNHDAVMRFEREAQAAGRIGSKHIVEVLDLGDLPSGDRYMVMEYLDGEDLTRRIRKCGRLTPAELYPLAVQLLEGLGGAHAAGIIHRDLKPDNVYLIPSGEAGDFVKILDFGISKFNTLGGELSMTSTGVVMGTPYYMSPEQAKGAKNLDARTDLYSAGVILYEALAGHVPYRAETFNELIIKIVLEEPPPLDPPADDAEAAFQAIVKRAMGRETSARFQTAQEFQAALHEWAEAFGLRVGRPPLPTSGSVGGSTQMHGTQKAWAQTAVTRARSGDGPVKSSKTMLVAGGLAVLVLGGGAAFVLGSSGGDATPGAEVAAASAKADADAKAEAEARARAEAEAAAAAEKAAAAEREAAAAKAAAAQAAAAEAAAVAQASADRAAPSKPTGEKSTAAPGAATAPATLAKKAAPAPTKTSSAAAAPAPAPKAAPAPKPAPSTEKSTTSTGRTIRSSF